MPFKSNAQRRLFYAKERAGELPEGTAARWQKETGKRKLPDHVPKHKKKVNPKTGHVTHWSTVSSEKKAAFEAGVMDGMELSSKGESPCRSYFSSWSTS